MAEFWYNVGKTQMLAGSTGEIDFIANEIVIIALEVDFEENAHEDVAELLATAATEVTSTGYTGGFEGAGRLSLASKAIAVDQANDRAEIDCADITWSSISQAASETWVAFVVVKELTSDALSPMIAHLEPSGVPLTPNGSDIKITINAEGLLQLT
jgi:hypothetical protein